MWFDHENWLGFCKFDGRIMLATFVLCRNGVISGTLNTEYCDSFFSSNIATLFLPIGASFLIWKMYSRNIQSSVIILHEKFYLKFVEI